MAIIKKFSSLENLSRYGVFLNDTNPNSDYFRITELGENLTGGKNGFLIEGSECLKETTDIKIEILDVNGNPVYFEPGQGIPQYYEGLSKVVGIYVYEDTPIGLGKITILGELKSYFDKNDAGNKLDIPEEWRGVYNVKWERTININKNLANETRVRFYKRPKISIEEISKPIFTKTIPIAIHSGSIEGQAFTPPEGQDYNSYAGGVLYKLIHDGGPLFSSSMDETQLFIEDLNFNPTVKEVLSETELLVDSAYTSSDGTVSGFGPKAYNTSFENNDGVVTVESALTGSFAKIKLTNLKTFVGDVARVKVFRKSRNEAGDFTLVQEQKLESTELLKDITTQTDTELSYGIFNDYNLSNYWITSSNSPVTVNNTQLLNSIKVDYVGSGTQLIYTSESIEVGSDIEYNLSFKTKLSGSASDSKQINAYLSSSEFTQSIVTVSGSNDTLQKFDVNKNIISTNSGSARLVFEVNGDDWYISNVSFRNAEETAFSPDEFTLVQQVPRKLDSEFFDFKFEFYDINNNFIPVEIGTSKEFSGGNLTTTSNVRLLEFETDRTAFRFSSGSLGNPPFQQSRFRVTSNGLTGSITFASAAFDKNGVYIDPSSYGGDYPGGLTSNNVLTLASFSGSDDGVIVGSITYTASIEDKEEIETITRFEDGEPASALIVTSNQNQFFYKATDLSVEPSGQQIQIQAQRKNLASDTTTITVNSGSGKPGLTQGSTVNGITSFTLNASDYSFGTGNTTYEFSGSDEFGSQFVDRISIAPVKKFDGVSLQLTNNNQTFNATSQSAVSSLEQSSGSVTFRIGTELIQFQNGLSSNNRFDIAGITGSGCVPTSTTPSKNEYSLSSFNSDSGSLTINIDYKDGSGDISEFQQIVNYTKAVAGVTGQDGQDGQDGEDGQDGTNGPPGPGVTYRGLWSVLTEYVSSSLRRDVVEGTDGSYYLAKSSHTASNLNQRPVDGGSYTTYWESFGAEFSSVATDILFSQDVYANRTVNIGSSGSGHPVIALNADSSNAGTGQDPYIAIGGITQYAANNGIFIGYDGGDKKLSLKGGASDGFLTWDGSSLNIQGSINITGGATADSLSALNSETSSLQSGVNNSILSGSAAASAAQTNAQSFASTAAANSVTSGSNAASTAQSNAQNFASTAAGNAATSASNAQSTANTAQSTANSALTAAASSGSVDPTTQRVTKNASPSGAGLYFGANNLGYYNSSDWKAYLSSSGEFFLGSPSDSNYLEWNGSSLNIAGSITITAGPTAAQLSSLNSATSSLSSDISTAQTNAQNFASTAAANSVTSGSNAASTAQTNAQNFASTAAANSVTSGSNAASTAQSNAQNFASTAAGNAATSASNAQSTANTANSLATNASSSAGTALQNAATALSTANTNAGLIPNTSTGLIDFSPTPSGAGLYFGANNIGYYASGNWDAFLSSSGAFYLGGEDGALQWNGSNLTISGDGTFTGTLSGGTVVGGTMFVPSATNPKFQVDADGIVTADEAKIEGEITASAGLIGSWKIDDVNVGGSLKDSEGRMVLNPTDKKIQLYNSSLELKAQINSDDSLTSPGLGNIYIASYYNNQPGSTLNNPSGPTSSTTSTSLQSGTPTYTTNDGEFTVSGSNGGDYQLSGLDTIPTWGYGSSVAIVSETISSGTGNPSGNLTPNMGPSTIYQSGVTYKQSYDYIYLVIEKTSDNSEVAEIFLGYAYARSGYSISNYYQATGTGIYDWQYNSGYSVSGHRGLYTVNTPITTTVTLENNTTYRVRYKRFIKNSSGRKSYLNGSSYTPTNTYYTHNTGGTNAIYSGLDETFQLNQPSNFVEISGGGIQAVTNSDQFVKMFRVSPGTYSSTLFQVRGGQTMLSSDSDTETNLYSHTGRNLLVGRNTLGYSWYGGDFYNPLANNHNSNIMKGIVMQSDTSESPGSSSSPKNLAYNIAQGYMHIWLQHSSSTNRYYELPNQLDGGTYNPASTIYIPVGYQLWLFNESDGDSVFVRGLLHGASSSNNYHTLQGGGALLCVYMGSSSAQDPTESHKWIVYSEYDNTWS